MSMWDTDRAYGGHRLDSVFPIGEGVGSKSETFILYAVNVLPEKVETSLPGGATKTLLRVASRAEPDVVFIVGTLASAIADKAERASATDFPAVVRLERIQPKQEGFGPALVLTFVKMYADEVGADQAAEYANNADVVEWGDQDKTPDWLASREAAKAGAQTTEPPF